MHSVYEMGAATGATFFTRVATEEIIPNAARISEGLTIFPYADESSLDTH
jgi:hypothetical protein